MEAPDRIYALIGAAGMPFWTTEPANNLTPYLRATPELLAVIEAQVSVARHSVKPFTDAGGIKQWAVWVVERDRLREAADAAALAFAKSQDHPDAG